MLEMEEIVVNNIEEIDGVLYRDIKDVITSKELLENILFTTKLMFASNEELIEFINKLMEFGYEDIALDYVENIYDKAGFDFSKVKTYENKNK